MENLTVENQEIIHGSAHLRGEKKFNKIDFMTENMKDNLAYKSFLINNSIVDNNKKN